MVASFPLGERLSDSSQPGARFRRHTVTQMKPSTPSLHKVLHSALLAGFALLAFACAKPKPADPDFVVFATGSLFGQLHTCG